VAAARGAVGLLRGHDELATTADPHPRDALLPAGDEGLQREVDGLPAAPRRVELVAGVVLDAEVVHVDGRARGGLGAVADDDVLDDELDGGRALGGVDLGLAVGVSHAFHPTGDGRRGQPSTLPLR
jgi:hypothetical protein